MTGGRREGRGGGTGRRRPEAAPMLPLNRSPLTGTPKARLNYLSALSADRVLAGLQSHGGLYPLSLGQWPGIGVHTGVARDDSSRPCRTYGTAVHDTARGSAPPRPRRGRLGRRELGGDGLGCDPAHPRHVRRTTAGARHSPAARRRDAARTSPQAYDAVGPASESPSRPTPSRKGRLRWTSRIFGRYRQRSRG